jgi:hypothetical protein
MRGIRALLLFLAFIMFFGADGQNSYAVSSQLLYDTTHIAIIPFVAKNFNYEVDSTNTPFTLTQDDISEIDTLFHQSVDTFDSKLAEIFKQFSYIDLKQYDYKRQYVCYLNKKGEKIVYINCFCNSMNLDWHKDVVFVFDGGKCFFHLIINLKTKKYIDFFVNGTG